MTLDPCGHLCSLDGVQVTVPTPLTQGKRGHAHICTLSHLCFTLIQCHLLASDKNVCRKKQQNQMAFPLEIIYKRTLCVNQFFVVFPVQLNLSPLFFTVYGDWHPRPYLGEHSRPTLCPQSQCVLITGNFSGLFFWFPLPQPACKHVRKSNKVICLTLFQYLSLFFIW